MCKFEKSCGTSSHHGCKHCHTQICDGCGRNCGDGSPSAGGKCAKCGKAYK